MSIHLTPLSHKLLGITANWMLFGTLWVQVYLYYVAFPKDTRILKWIVFILLVLETTQTATMTHDAIQALIIECTDPNVFNVIRKVWFSIPLLTGLIACITQGFYCYRIAVLTRSKYAVTLTSMLTLGHLAASIAVAIQTKRAILLTRLLSQKRSLVTIGMSGGCSLACDIVISAIMTHQLKKRDTGFENTHRIIVRLIRLTIETGCITALSTGSVLVLVYLPGHPPYYQLTASISAKTYSNAMMAVLNSRVKVVSNIGAYGAPWWNESVQPNGSNYLAGKAQDILFRKDSETGIERSNMDRCGTF
ncbi:hypothetical protein HYPSUDRAFT_43569 [Hypholoma sublateritium FD-334 SS-4]|uniref:DUF6534 domain-containing protein n=1 Tax=Hypholoma sublateritium (strain FD-334 SS-4) TaxID=945553 RepID=A0A0D2M9H9_HYPSF|nr:hypothetical protein HYPSUDRAFT_43569 [Hypholoma sublateritium FD-334 SS-4]